MIAAVIGISTPSFVVATLLQYLLAMKLTIFPVARWGSWMHLCLPALALSAMPTAFIARLVRSSMVEVLQQEYIMTAKAKGLSIWRIATRHVLRNSLIPVISYIGPLSASVMTGSFVVEKVFAIPGLGQWFVTSVMNRDYTVIMALTIFYSAILMATVFLVDLAYLWIDPRIRLLKK
jgi:oligopeptide transport system permease protein